MVFLNWFIFLLDRLGFFEGKLVIESIIKFFVKLLWLFLVDDGGLEVIGYIIEKFDI